MMKKLRKCAIFLLIPIHLFLYDAECSSGRLFIVTVILTVLADMALSVWQLQLLTRREGSVKPFFRDFRVYLAQAAVLLAAEYLISLVIPQDSGMKILGPRFSQELWLAVCIITVLACALICMAVGAARTMLYHDDKNRKGE